LKTKLPTLLFLLAFPFFLFPLSFADSGEPGASGDSGAPEDLAFRLTEQMSDEQALAQTFMLGWVGAEPSPLIMDWIRSRNIGGVKIFGWNTGDTRKLAETVGELQKNALAAQFGIPLFVATDQEGGLVRHVKGATSETPGNMAIGASGRPIDAYWSGYYIGRELSLLGINMNFAPAVDLYTNQDSTLIGPRSFGTDPARVGILGAAFVKGLTDTGIVATAKHYPGHGDTDLDSHGVLPRLNVPFDVLWDRELVPYRLLAKEGLPAVMSGHLAFPGTQAGETPASLSSWFLKDLLRGRIGYKGLIITDDLLMNGAAGFAGSLSRAAKMALIAGNDIIMISKTPSLYDPVWTYLLSSMKNEPDFRERVRDACRRILAVKLEYLRGGNKVPYVPDLARVDAGVADPGGNAFFLSLAARSVTVVAGRDLFPLSPEKAGKVLLAGNYADFFSAGKKAYPGAVSYWYGSSQDGDLISYARNADTVIFCLSDRAGLGILKALRALNKKTIVLSVLSPVYLKEVPWVDAAVAVYSYAPESFIAGFSVILGRIPGEGELPFPLKRETRVLPGSGIRE